MTILEQPATTTDVLGVRVPARTLARHELGALARAVAAAPASWTPHVRFEGERRHYASLHRDQHVDVWVLSWMPSSDTGWHDHDTSSGAVAVTAGELAEDTLAIGGPGAVSRFAAGDSFTFGPDHIHRMHGLADRSVSVHAYSPPLWRMGSYAISSTGLLRRTSLSYADELRPLDPG